MPKSEFYFTIGFVGRKSGKSSRSSRVDGGRGSRSMFALFLECASWKGNSQN